jgi:hypothetical protein
MRSSHTHSDRRSFLKTTATLASGITGLSLIPGSGFSIPRSNENDLFIIGPKEGYSPQIGTLVSMMMFMHVQIMNSVKGLSQAQLDYLLDDKANSIGALLFHLAATDAFYHIHTFQGVKWGSWDDSDKKKWGVAMSLGDAARKEIKGNNLVFYINLLQDSREKTFAEFRKRDDNWLMTVDQGWAWGPTNNYCKWFHVCEHESNHNGQIKLLVKRIPGAKPGNE